MSEKSTWKYVCGCGEWFAKGPSKDCWNKFHDSPKEAGLCAELHDQKAENEKVWAELRLAQQEVKDKQEEMAKISQLLTVVIATVHGGYLEIPRDVWNEIIKSGVRVDVDAPSFKPVIRISTIGWEGKVH